MQCLGLAGKPSVITTGFGNFGFYEAVKHRKDMEASKIHMTGPRIDTRPQTLPSLVLFSEDTAKFTSHSPATGKQITVEGNGGHVHATASEGAQCLG